MIVQCNINDYIYVKLTDEVISILIEKMKQHELAFGREFTEQDEIEEIEHLKRTVDEDGYKAFQFWNFMSKFGDKNFWIMGFGPDICGEFRIDAEKIIKQ